MENLKTALTFLGVIALILVVGGFLMLVVGGLSIGFQAVWAMIPFGISGFLLGVAIIVGTFFAAKRFFPDRTLNLDWTILNQIEYVEILGYLYGVFLIIASVFWFILPNPVIQAFPSMKDSLPFYVSLPLLLYGVGACLQGAVKGWRHYLPLGLFFTICAIAAFSFLNYLIWNMTEKFPGSYYGMGKVLFASIMFQQIIYLTFFHIIPSLNEATAMNKEELVETDK